MHKKIKRRVFQALALIAIIVPMDRPVAASNAAGLYTIFGEGVDSCGKWAANRPYDPGSSEFVSTQHITDVLMEEAWVRGFVSLYNQAIWKGNNVASETDGRGMYAWIDQYCASHPTDNISDATAELLIFLSKGPHPNSK